MLNRRIDARVRQGVTLEIGRLETGGVLLVTSLPGRESVASFVWQPPVPWEDIQLAVLKMLADWLWLTGGVQQELH